MDRLFPVPTKVPSQDPLNHFKVVPDPPVAVSIIFPLSSLHKIDRSTETDVGATAEGLTDTTTWSVDAQAPVTLVTVNVYVVVAAGDAIGLAILV